MSLYVTTHNTDGKAIFSKELPPEHHEMSIPIGTIQTLWSNHSFPMNLSTEADIEQYKQDRESKFFPGGKRICPENGTATCMISMEPGAETEAESVPHRTMTLDVIYILEGEIEIRLDSGEKRTAKAGDSIVQRGTMHKWVNVTPNGGWARWIAFIQAIAEPLVIGDKTLRSEWAH
jgi:quercetin dioxygenase-like cupin family protein